MPSSDCHSCQNSRWSHEETRLLIKLWGSDTIKKKFVGTSRDFLVYNELADAINAYGFQKSAQQVRLKIKNMKREYKIALSKRRLSGGRAKLTFRYFNELDKFMGSGSSQHTVSAPTVIYMDQEIATARKDTDEESMEDTVSLIPAASPSENIERLDFEEGQTDYEVAPSEIQAAATLTSSDEESLGGCSEVPITTTKSSNNANSDHALYTAKSDGENMSPEDVSSIIKKSTKQNNSKLNKMEEILNRVLDTTLDKFMTFEQQIEEKNREDTKSFRNEVLALERKKLEESVTQTLQNDRLICLMESLVSNSQ